VLVVNEVGQGPHSSGWRVPPIGGTITGPGTRRNGRSRFRTAWPGPGSITS
jgi:hypothetical protein